MRALALAQQGWLHRDIAAALDVSEGAVSRWLPAARAGGPEALCGRRPPGRPADLTAAQQDLIPEFLRHGAEAYGFRGDVWTCARVAKVIDREFGVRYHRGHVARLLRHPGWTPQRPVTRAKQRDETAIAAWRRDTWPRLRRQADRERRALVFVDESGFYLLPGVLRTYSPRGQTPVLDVFLTRDHLSVMGASTPAGQWYALVRDETLTGAEAVLFLKHLQRQLGERLLVLWDGSPIHRGDEVRELVAATAGAIRLEALPTYAPDLMPVEGIWHRLKQVELGSVCCEHLGRLWLELDAAFKRLRTKPHLIQAGFAQAGPQV